MVWSDREIALIDRNHRLLSQAAEARLRTEEIIAQSDAAVRQAVDSRIAVIGEQ